MSTSGQDVVLVAGATGNVGRQVATQLLEAGAGVRAVTRDPAAAGLRDGAEVVRADLTDPASLRPHLAGVEAGPGRAGHREGRPGRDVPARGRFRGQHTGLGRADPG